MIISKEQQESMLHAAKPLIKWLNENCHPHCCVLVDVTSVCLSESIARHITLEAENAALLDWEKRCAIALGVPGCSPEEMLHVIDSMRDIKRSILDGSHPNLALERKENAELRAKLADTRNDVLKEVELLILNRYPSSQEQADLRSVFLRGVRALKVQRSEAAIQDDKRESVHPQSSGHPTQEAK